MSDKKVKNDDAHSVAVCRKRVACRSTVYGGGGYQPALIHRSRAGIPVTDYETALTWYERLLGFPPTFIPDDTEAVWELTEHRFVYIDVRPEQAGHALHTIFVADLDVLIAQIASRGIDPVERETYSNGVRKVTYHDPDGNEIGFGGAPL